MVDEFVHLILLLFEYRYLCLEAHILLEDFVETLLQLESFGVQSFLVLGYLFGKNPGKIVGGHIGLHEADLFAIWVLVGLLRYIVGASLSPVSSMSWLG